MRAAQTVMAELAASGLSPDQLALVMELSATVAAEARPAVDETAQRRRERDREYQRERRQNRTISADSDDKGSLEVSPHTPLPKPSNSTPFNSPKVRDEKIAAVGTCLDRAYPTKRMIPKDWMPPTLADLPPRARALAEQWTDASYQTQAEGFLLYWLGQRKMRSDWTGTWANWVIRVHSQVMRDQKFGNAPTDAPKLKSITPERAAEMAEEYVTRLESEGRHVEAQQYRARCTAKLRVA